MIEVSDLRRQSEALRPQLAAAIQSVLDSGWFILGERVRRFEAAFARYLGVPHAVGVANGTDALEFGLRALGVQAGMARPGPGPAARARDGSGVDRVEGGLRAGVARGRGRCGGPAQHDPPGHPCAAGIAGARGRVRAARRQPRLLAKRLDERMPDEARWPPVLCWQPGERRLIELPPADPSRRERWIGQTRTSARACLPDEPTFAAP